MKAIVDVPGEMHAHYEDGRIVKWVFMPHGSNAGWFGPSATVVQGDDSEWLDVESTDGLFWKAVQKEVQLIDPFLVYWEE